MKHVVIIGGGITGLAAANRIIERTHESNKHTRITLLEAGDRLGGIVKTRERDGFMLECGPDAFISEKPAALDLVRRLGIESQLSETNKNFRRSFIVHGGRLMPVPEGFQLLAPARLWPFIKSDLFSWPGKARVALELFLPRRRANGDDSNDESLADFVRRRFGREALEHIAQPMVGGIYTADPEKLSLRATMPRFLDLEDKHRSLIKGLRRQEHSNASGARYSLFLSFDRGMQVLTDKLAENIAKSPAAAIRMDTPVESVSLEDSWTIRTSQGETYVADALCLALPAFTCAQLLGRVDETLSSELAGIPYASSATISLAYRRDDIPHPLDGFGFVVPFVERRTLMACTFSSVKFSGRAPQGHALLRAFVGGALQPEVLEMDDDELLTAVRGDLRELLGIQPEPLFAEISRWPRSMPQYHVGHLERLARIQNRVAALPSLALAGNAYDGIGIPDCVRSGETAANRLV
jgi:oxygen-dependent protoporphyrinogen oxidase